MFNEQFISDHIWLFLGILFTDYLLKAIALWVAARKNSKVWFILLFLLNTIGILPLFYLFYFSKKEDSTKDIADNSTKEPS